jgi:transglutaminase-like putative cysteine protease
MRHFPFVLFLALMISISAAHAQSAKQSSTIEMEIDEQSATITTIRLELTPLNAASVQGMSQVRLNVTSNQTVAILDAYTRKADGRRIPVDEQQIVTQDGVAGAAASYADMKIKLIPFREIDVGDTTVLVTRISEKQHYFPNQFSYLNIVPLAARDIAIDFQLRAPKSLAILHAAHQFNYDEHEDGEHIIRHWSGHFPANTSGERDVADLLSILPSFQFSTLPNYESLAKAYYDAAAPKAAVTPAVQKLVDELTSGKVTTHDKAEAIFDWMTKNVQYVAVYFGSGRYVPNDADTVLARRLGDCKDHVTLMSALLAAKGIASEHVLINAGTNYDLPETSIVQAFNHVILYVPELDLYADPTAPQTTFGVLLRSEMGKPVVRVSDKGAVVTRTPIGESSQNVFRSDTRISVNEDGSMRGETRVEATGEQAQILREWVASAETSGEQTQLEALAKLRKISGQLKMSALSSRDRSLPYKLTTSWINGEPAQIVEKGWKPQLGLSPIGDALSTFFGLFDSHRKRNYPILCRPGEDVQNITVTLPAGVTLKTIPPKLAITGHYYKFEKWWESSGQTLQVHTKLLSTIDRRVCKPDIIDEIVIQQDRLNEAQDPVLHFVRKTAQD